MPNTAASWSTIRSGRRAVDEVDDDVDVGGAQPRVAARSPDDPVGPPTSQPLADRAGARTREAGVRSALGGQVELRVVAEVERQGDRVELRPSARRGRRCAVTGGGVGADADAQLVGPVRGR